MIELIVLINLIETNVTQAILHGRSPMVAKIYTVFLWFYFQGIGLFIGASICKLLGWPMKLLSLYLFASLPAAVVGALLSKKIARRGKVIHPPPHYYNHD